MRKIFLIIFLLTGVNLISNAQILDAVGAIGSILGGGSKTVVDKGANDKLNKLKIEAFKQSRNMQEVLNIYTKVNQGLQEVYVIKQVASNHINIQRELLALIDMLSHSEMEQTREVITTKIEQIKQESEQTIRSVKTIMSPGIRMTAGERLNILYSVRNDQEKTLKNIEQSSRGYAAKEDFYAVIKYVLP